jgi:Fur family transcriptional regulator, ferric uptake regulator
MKPHSSDATNPLRAAGLRQTPQRQGILRVLEKSSRPLTVDEIWRTMAEDRSGIPTVYRNLERFVQEGLVEPLMGMDQVVRYARCHSHEHHHHLQCERCGGTVEVGACGLSAVEKAIEQRTGFRITRHQLQLFGLCPKCR